MTINAQHLAHFLHAFPLEWNMLVDEVCRYLDEEDDGQVLGGGDDKASRFLVAYHLAKHTLALHRDEIGLLDGVAMFYRFNGSWNWRDIMTWRPDDEDGKTLVMAWMHTRNSRATREIIGAMVAETPDWADYEIHAIRKNRLVKYPKSIVRRMLKAKRN